MDVSCGFGAYSLTLKSGLTDHEGRRTGVQYKFAGCVGLVDPPGVVCMIDVGSGDWLPLLTDDADDVARFGQEKIVKSLGRRGGNSEHECENESSHGEMVHDGAERGTAVTVPVI